MESEKPPCQIKKFAVLMEKIDSKIDYLESNKNGVNRWMFGSEVRDLLRISQSTLRRMRLANKIPYKKIGQTFYYPSIFFDEVLLNTVKKRYAKDWDEE